MARLHGTVSSGGGLISGAIVVLFAADETKWRYPPDRYVIAVRTGSRGEFEIPNIVPGPYHAAALRKLPSVGPLTGVMLHRLKSESAAVALSLKADQELVVNLDVR